MRQKERDRAVRLRRQGYSYDEIKSELGLAKSTLSHWLRDLPLSDSQLAALQARSKRIEKFRSTFALKRRRRLEGAALSAQELLGSLSRRDRFIAGAALYWAEGYKTADSTTALANTDPAMCRFFISWLESLGIDRADLKIKLQLYADMNASEETRFWSRELRLPLSAFRKPYVKQSKFKDLTYRRGFGHGTCNILYYNRPVADLVLALVDEVRNRTT